MVVTWWIVAFFAQCDHLDLQLWYYNTFIMAHLLVIERLWR